MMSLLNFVTFEQIPAFVIHIEWSEDHSWATKPSFQSLWAFHYLSLACLVPIVESILEAFTFSIIHRLIRRRKYWKERRIFPLLSSITVRPASLWGWPSSLFGHMLFRKGYHGLWAYRRKALHRARMQIEKRFLRCPDLYRVMSECVLPVRILRWEPFHNISSRCRCTLIHGVLDEVIAALVTNFHNYRIVYSDHQFGITPSLASRHEGMIWGIDI